MVAGLAKIGAFHHQQAKHQTSFASIDLVISILPAATEISFLGLSLCSEYPSFPLITSGSQAFSPTLHLYFVLLLGTAQT